MKDSSSRYFCPSIWPLDMPWPYLVKITTVCAMISFVIVFCNSALIYGPYKMQQLNTITNKLILLISLSDLRNGLFISPIVSVMIALKNKFRNCVMELAVQYCAVLLGYFSFFMLICVPMDRYLQVTKLNKYSAFMNEFRMKIIVAISLVASATTSYLLIALPFLSLQIAQNIFNLFCLSSVFLVYSKIIWSITLHVERFKDMLRSAGSDASNRDTRREITATKTIRLVLAAMLALYLPYNICSAFWTYFKYHQGRNPPLALNIAECWAHIILLCNAFINAILFGYGNSVVRRFLIHKLSIRRLA